MSLQLPRCRDGETASSGCSAASTATPAGASTATPAGASTPATATDSPAPRTPRRGESTVPSVAPGAAPGASDGLGEQLEDLRLQNAVLRKSLAMLQQSVVESMKGNKAQFVGGGHFRRRQGAAGGTVSMSESGLGRDSDAESLRISLAESRKAVREAIAERDRALGEVAGARREVAELGRRNQELRARVAEGDAQASQLEDSRRSNAELADRLAEAVAQGAVLEHGRSEAARRAEELDAKVAELAEEATALHSKAAASEGRAVELRRELADATRRLQGRELAETDAAATEAAARLRDLEAELEHLRATAAAESSRLERFAGNRHLMAQRLLSIAFGGRDGQSSLRPVFDAWSATYAAAREERLSARTVELEAEVARLALDAEHRAAEGANAAALDEEAKAKSREAEDARLWAKAAEEQLRMMEKQLAQAEVESAESRGQVSAAESRAKALEAEIETLRARCFVDGDSARSLQEALERLRLLEAELADAKGAGMEAERQLAERRLAEEATEERARSAEQRESKLAGDLEAATTTVAQARDAKEAATKLRDVAQKRVAELEAAAAEHLKGDAQKRAAVKELETVRAGLDGAEKSAREAEARATEADRKARTHAMRAQSLEERLQAAEAREAESQRREAEAERRSKGDDESRAEALAKAGQESAGRGEENAALKQEVSGLKLSLAEAKMSSKSSEGKLRALGDEHTTLLRALDEARSSRAVAAQRMEELEGGSARFQAEAGKALEEVRQKIRIMVTAPKVCVNVGGDSYDLHAPFPFAAIKDAVREEVMPKFAHVFAVGEEAGDSEIRNRVQQMVEELALNLQTKVHELMPQAEGTCNWDGFGSKCGGLGAK